MGEDRSEAMTAWLQQFVSDAATEERVAHFVTQVDDEVLRRSPEVARDAMLVADLHNSTRAQWRAFLVTLLEREHRLVLPDAAIALARSVARRGLELGVLLKIYRAGQQAIFRYLTDLTAGLKQGDPSRDQVLVGVWSRADRWMDEVIEQLITVYYEERQRLHEGAQARKAEAIHAILGGGAPQTSEASRALGHPVHAWQTGFVSWTAADTHDKARRGAHHRLRGRGGTRHLAPADDGRREPRSLVLDGHRQLPRPGRTRVPGPTAREDRHPTGRRHFRKRGARFPAQPPRSAGRTDPRYVGEL